MGSFKMNAIIAITQINDSYSGHTNQTRVWNFEYPDTHVENNSVQFSPTNPDCNPDFEATQILAKTHLFGCLLPLHQTVTGKTKHLSP